MANYAVVRTDKMHGTDDRTGLLSAMYLTGEEVKTPIENGNVVAIGGLYSDDDVSSPRPYKREIYMAGAPAGNAALSTLALVATPEITYEATKRALHEFRNEAGVPIRCYRLRQGDIFSVTAEALQGTSTDFTVGAVVELGATNTTKLKVVSEATSGKTTVGKILQIETVGAYTFYVIEVV